MHALCVYELFALPKVRQCVKSCNKFTHLSLYNQLDCHSDETSEHFLQPTRSGVGGGGGNDTSRLSN